MSGREDRTRVRVNRAPVMTLWAAVVAERLGHERDAALALGKAVTGLNALSKGRRLGIYDEPSDDEERGARRRRPQVELLGRRVPRDTGEDPAAVARYLERKFGAALPAVRAAMTELAASLPKRELEKRAYALYEKFRPAIPAGEKGWGAAGVLDLSLLRRLAREVTSPSRTAGR